MREQATLRAIFEGNREDVRRHFLSKPGFLGCFLGPDADDFQYAGEQAFCQFNPSIGNALFITLALKLCLVSFEVNRVTIFFELLDYYHRAGHPAYVESLITFYQYLKKQPTPPSDLFFESSAITESAKPLTDWIAKLEDRILNDRLTETAIQAFKAHCVKHGKRFDDLLPFLMSQIPSLEQMNPVKMNEHFWCKPQPDKPSTWTCTLIGALMIPRYFNEEDVGREIISANLDRYLTNHQRLPVLPNSLLLSYFISTFSLQRDFFRLQGRLRLLRALHLNIQPHQALVRGQLEHLNVEWRVLDEVKKIFGVDVVPAAEPWIWRPEPGVFGSSTAKTQSEQKPMEVFMPAFIHDDGKTQQIKTKKPGESEAVAEKLIAAIDNDNKEGLNIILHGLSFALDETIVKKVMEHIKSRAPHPVTDGIVLSFFINKHIFQPESAMDHQLNWLYLFVASESNELLLSRVKVESDLMACLGSILPSFKNSVYYYFAIALCFQKKQINEDQLGELLSEEMLVNQYAPPCFSWCIQEQLNAIFYFRGELYFDAVLQRQPLEGKSTGLLWAIQHLRKVSQGRGGWKDSGKQNKIQNSIRNLLARTKFFQDKIDIGLLLYVFYVLSPSNLLLGVKKYLLNEEERQAGWLFAGLSMACEGLNSNHEALFSLTRPRPKEGQLIARDSRKRDDLLLFMLTFRELRVDVNDDELLSKLLMMFLCEYRNAFDKDKRVRDLFLDWFVLADFGAPYRDRSLNSVDVPPLKEAVLSMIALSDKPILDALQNKLYLGGTSPLFNILMWDEAKQAIGETDAMQSVREKMRAHGGPSATVVNEIKSRVFPLVIGRSPSPRDAVLALSWEQDADAFKQIVIHHWLDYAFLGDNKEAMKADFIQAIKLLSEASFASLRDRLLLLIRQDTGMQQTIKTLIEGGKKNENPLLVFLRVGRTSYKIKNTKHYKEARLLCAPGVFSKIGKHVAIFAGKKLMDEPRVQGVANQMENHVPPSGF